MTLQRKAAVVLVINVAAMVTFLLLKLSKPAEPVYNGKPLSEWVHQCWNTNRAAAEDAVAAIRQIGTNGIPFFLNLMEARELPLKKKLRQVLPGKWHATLRL
jgi:hypothetical protein